jgi:hypothetical protein
MIIGNFKRQAKGYAGDLITLTHQAKLVFTPASKGVDYEGSRSTLRSWRTICPRNRAKEGRAIAFRRDVNTARDMEGCAGVAVAPSDVTRRAIGSPVLHDKPDGLLEWLWQDAQFCEARQLRRHHGVNLHELELISRDGWARQDRCCAGQRIPNRERDGEQDGLATSLACDAAEKLFVSVDPRSTAFERLRSPFGPLRYAGNRLGDVLYMGRLQSCRAAAEHRISRQTLEQLEDDRQECVIRPEHNRRTDQDRTGMGRPDSQFAFTAPADIR